MSFCRWTSPGNTCGGVDAPASIVGCRHRLGRAKDGTPQRMIRPELLREHLVHQVVRRVLDHFDFFEHHTLLARNLLGRQRRPQQHVAQQVERNRQMFVEDFDVVPGVLLRRERVDLSTNGIDLLREVTGRPRIGALEEHVLHKMRDATVGIGFVPGAAGQPDANGRRPHVRNTFGHKPEARRKCLRPYHGLKPTKPDKLFTVLKLQE